MDMRNEPRVLKLRTSKNPKKQSQIYILFVICKLTVARDIIRKVHGTAECNSMLCKNLKLLKTHVPTGMIICDNAAGAEAMRYFVI